MESARLKAMTSTLLQFLFVVGLVLGGIFTITAVAVPRWVVIGNETSGVLDCTKRLDTCIAGNFHGLEGWQKLVVGLMCLSILVVGVGLSYSLLLCFCQWRLTGSLIVQPVLSFLAAITCLGAIGVYGYHTKRELHHYNIQDGKFGDAMWVGLTGVVIHMIATGIGLLNAILQAKSAYEPVA